MALIASRSIGNAGTMEIHDDGWVVTMRIRSSDSATNSGAIPVNVYVDGAWTGWFNIAYPSGSPWVNVWVRGVGSTQSVAFWIGDTGTWGFGGGGDLWAALSRATRPNPPRVTGVDCGLDQITRNGMRFRYRWNGDGGSPVTSYAYQCSTRSDFADVGWAGGTMSGDLVRSDLNPDTLYYWRVRCQNAVGLSDPSPTISARTLSAGFLGGKTSAFVPFPTTIGKGTAFADTQIFIGKGGAFVPLGS